VSERSEPFLPVPRVARQEDGSFDLVGDREYSAQADGVSSPDGTGSSLPRRPSHSIGRLRGFQGNYGCFVRSYAYICSLGAAGLKDASETAVLNANYLLARLHELGVCEQLPLAYSNARSNAPDGDGGPRGLCLHEFVLSGGPMKRALQIKTLDLAKRLLDYGYHPPTVYFPLLVEEALMVEPTETETKETLDGFAEALAELLREASEDPEIALQAPYTTPVRRLDEVGAAKRPVIRQAL
jgi:glycine dehydrogenase subunit 2